MKCFFPVFTLDWTGLLERIKTIEGNYGILAPISCYGKFLKELRNLDKPFFIDSGVFKNSQKFEYFQLISEFDSEKWVRKKKLADEIQLRQTIRDYFYLCDRYSPDYVFAPDIIGNPLISLYLARLSWQEYQNRPRNYDLIGVVQVGAILYDYDWQENPIPSQESFLPHYYSPKSFLSSLISEYRNIGYQYVALGGLLKPDSTRRTGLKFGLSNPELDSLLTWSRPDFILGGLALSRLEVLRKHKVWADSTGWLWWTPRYDYKRFKDRNVLQEVVDLV
jgi:hypothetical protein